jgi:hypothetical protein
MAASNSYTPNLGETVTEFVKPKRYVDTTFIHCTATSNPSFDAKACHDLHVDSNGWSAIGYHMLCTTQGEMQYGRDLEQTPAAQSGYNEGSIAISLNGLEVEDFDEAQFDQLRWLCNEINNAYGGQMRFRGHNEVAAKACPVFDYHAVLGLDANGYMTSTPMPGQPPKSTIPMIDITVSAAQLGLGDKHPHVIALRALLLRWGAASKEALFPSRDKELLMTFGETVDQALKGFQKAQNLVADGICGRASWERLLDVGDD